MTRLVTLKGLATAMASRPDMCTWLQSWQAGGVCVPGYSHGKQAGYVYLATAMASRPGMCTWRHEERACGWPGPGVGLTPGVPRPWYYSGAESE